LLIGSYSIDVFPQSNTNEGFLTFTIKETGVINYPCDVTLYKLNGTNIVTASSNSSDNTSMFGQTKERGLWYLIVNTTNLTPGSYLLHAEKTDLITEKFNSFGSNIKQADKLFIIPS
jgi:hypothetical protein